MITHPLESRGAGSPRQRRQLLGGDGVAYLPWRRPSRITWNRAVVGWAQG